MLSGISLFSRSSHSSSQRSSSPTAGSEDEGSAFEDAADGQSQTNQRDANGDKSHSADEDEGEGHEAGDVNEEVTAHPAEGASEEGERTGGLTNGAEGPDGRKDQPEDSPTSNAPSSKKSGAQRKGKGVAALAARFEGGKSDASPQATEGNDRQDPSSASSSSSPETSSAHRLADEAQLSSEEQSNAQELFDGDAGDEDAVESRTPRRIATAPPSSPPMSPSQGALSLIDPGETISNPFSSENVAPNPTVPTTADDDGTMDTEPPTPQPNLKRFTAVSDKQAAPTSTHSSLTYSHTNQQDKRFSVVSLGASPRPSPRFQSMDLPTEAAEEGQEDSDDPSSSSQFLTRNMARLSADGRSKRDSSGPSAERIQQRLSKLRDESRPHSLSKPARGTHTSMSNTVVSPSHEKEEQSAGSIGVGEASGVEVESDKTAGDREERRLSWDGPPVDDVDDDYVDWDFWGQVMNNYQDIASTQPQKLSRAIQTGIPGSLRGMMWQLMSSSKDEEMELIYAHYTKQSSPHEKMIRKDLARTFPSQNYFQDGQGIGQENLFNVVKAYSLYDEEVGYCQGMQFVVGPLLLNMPDEEAFSTLVRLMKSYDLRGHFVPNMPALQLRLFQFERLLEEFLPLLHRHLVRSGIKVSMFASGWFMTLFSYRSPLSICYRILDSVFAEGIEALFRFALALMAKNEDQLLTMGFDEAVPLLAARVFDIYKRDNVESTTDSGDTTSETLQDGDGREASRGDAEQNPRYRVGEFVRDAFHFKITPFMLDAHASDFAEQVKVATAHRREVEMLKMDNRALQSRVKDLEGQLGSLQQEHVDLVKNVVMAKLAKEEMAEELVRYKMMYAEAALLADQSGVSGQGLTHISLSPSRNESRTSHNSQQSYFSRQSSQQG